MPGDAAPDDPVLPRRVQSGQTDRRDGSAPQHGAGVQPAPAPLAAFGIGDTVNTAVSGKVCLIQRGTVDFATKVTNCQNSGGV
ncbi:PA domain-containing protein, partial [Azospirillum isscasi]